MANKTPWRHGCVVLVEQGKTEDNTIRDLHNSSDQI